MKIKTPIVRFSFIALCCFLNSMMQGQNVGINSSGATPNATALLDVDASPSNDKGILIPRLALTQTTSNAPIGASVATSLMLYNTATVNDVTPGYYYWDGAKWVRFMGSNTAWSLTGNSGTTAGTNFIGTTDAVDWVVKTNNTERMRVLSGGNVGIGTNNPSALLHLSFSSTDLTYLLSQGLRITNSSTTDGTYSNIKFASNDLGGTNVYGAMIGGVITSHAVNGVNGDMFFHTTINTGSVERMRILSNGNIGMGTSAPAYPLHVYGSSNGSLYEVNENANAGASTIAAVVAKSNAGLAGFQITSTAGGSWAEFGTSGSGGFLYSIWNNTGDHVWRTTPTSIERMRLTSGGYLGIGTTTPEVPLHVVTDNTATSPRCMIVQYNANNSNSAFLILRKTRGTSYTTPAIIQNGDQIGTLVAEAYDGTANIRTGGNIKFSANGVIAAGSIPTDIVFNTGSSGIGTEAMRITSAQFVGIGCSAPQYALHVIGDIASSATVRSTNAVVTGAITACSDLRYKKDITPLSNALTDVLKLQGVNYNWKTKEFPDKKFVGTKQMGLIAQEVEKIYPELVFTDTDGYKSVDYAKLTPALVEAIKEQQKLIEAQQKLITAQQNSINELKVSVENIKESLNARAQK